MTKFTITKLQTLEGDENLAFECNLCVNRKVVAKVSNTGTGGCHHYNWKNPVVRTEYESQITDELIWDLIEEKLPPQIVEIPIDIVEDQLRAANQLTQTCDAIAHQLGEGWSVSPGIGGTTKVGHADGFSFYCFIELDVDPGYHTHNLCTRIGFPDEIAGVYLTQQEEVHRKIPSFDLRTDTVEEIASVLQEKLDWLKLKLPELRDRANSQRRSIEHIQQLGSEVARKLGMAFKSDGQGDGFSFERSSDDRLGESISIRVGPQSYSNGTSSFSLSAYRISDEKLLKLLEFCKQLDI